MFEGLLHFPPEIREHFYSYCSKSDLINVACCCKAYYESVKYLLWENIKFSWVKLERGIPKEILENLQWTNTLTFHKESNDNSDDEDDETYIQFHNMNYSDDNDDSEDNFNECSDDHYTDDVFFRWKEITWVEVASAYKKIINSCDFNRLTTLNVTGIIGTHGLLLTTILRNIQDLSLTNVNLITTNGWQHLAKFKQIKKLSLFNCGIEDNSLGEIIGSTKLDELVLNQCSFIRESSLEYISNSVQLRKVTISHNSFISGNSFRLLGNLANLIKLDLEYTNINDFALSNLWMKWKHLKVLNLYGSVNITDNGLCDVTKLDSLEELNINMCTNISNIGFSYLEKVPIQKLSFSWSNNVNDSIFHHLCKMASLKELNIININNRFSVIAIDEFCKKTSMKKKTVFNSWIFSFFTLKKD